jgi:transmembrane sensor
VITPIGSDPIDWTRVSAWLAGELPPEEAAGLEAWMAADPARAREIEQLRALWQATGEARDGWNAGGALEALKQTAAERGVRPYQRIRRVSGAQREFSLPAPRWWMSAAAALLILGTTGGAVWYLAARGAAVVPPPPRLVELVTPRGQRAELSLPDGSRVMLGPDSRLQYAADFASRRDLTLEGEAYFEVVHDDTRPMRVFTRRGVTEDLGTAFAVSDHRAGPMRVIVAEGSVMLRVPPDSSRPGEVTDSVLLEANDLGQLRTDGRLLARRDVDVDSYLAWREGRLVFRGTPLREVLFRLSTWYDIDIALGDSALSERPFTASFRHETAEQVLRVLSVALDLTIEHRGGLLLVQAGGRS